MLEEYDIKYALNRKYAPKPDKQKAWDQLSRELNISESNDDAQAKRHRRHVMISFITGVAATVAIFFVISLLTKPVATDDLFFAANNEPQGITLTSSDGTKKMIDDKSIDLLEKQMTGEKAKTESKTAMLTLATSRGKDYQATLSDGTRVWLNADSRIEFPEKFTGGERRVKLKGEAYFEVAKDKDHPFIVETDYFNTTVLGTTFNIKAYSPKDANIVLIDGSVKVIDTKKQEILLKPGQKLSFFNTLFTVSDVDTYPYTQWREGFFYFEDQTLYEIMQTLGRWYNVSIAFDAPEKMNIRLHFVAERSKGVEEAIRNLNAVESIHVEYNNHIISIR